MASLKLCHRSRAFGDNLSTMGMFQQRYVKRHEIWHKPAYTQRDVAFLRLPKSDCFQAANFGGLIPTESWSFSSEKSYSPNRLICCQDTTEPFAMAWNRLLAYDLTDLLGQVEIVPAGDGIFDEAFATLGHFLFLLFRLRKLPWISDGHGS